MRGRNRPRRWPLRPTITLQRRRQSGVSRSPRQRCRELPSL